MPFRILQMNQGILNGIRVLDFTWVLAGPYSTRILGDFGAEVIKVQSKKTARGAESNLTGYFNHWNRNKRSITLDMSFREAKEIVLKLTKISDVVIENYSPRVMSNWGLSYETLREAKPDLIMMSMSGMGQTGPWKDFVAFGPTLQALSGLTYLTSLADEPPTGMGYAYADPVAGLYGALAVLVALEYRDKTGKGQYIDLSQYDAICTLMGPALLDVAVNHKDICPQGNHSKDIPAAPYGCYQCDGTDRWCVIAVFNEMEWESLCDLLGRPDWTREERFSNLSRRKENREDLDKFLEQWTLQQSPEEVVYRLQKGGISAGVVQNAENLAGDPHLAARDFFLQLEHSVLGQTVSDTSPIQFKENPWIHWRGAPLLGEDNRYVYMELLGFTEEELSSHVEKGIIG
jgi:crotonobetainyl-CoA:carnitine CoA-transferase CaiB-like acyl-CoA transferase